MIQTPLRHRKGMRVTHWRRVSGRRRRQQAYVAPARLSARRSARRALPNKAQPQHRDPITQAELMHFSRRADPRRRPAATLIYLTFGVSFALTILLGLIPKSGNQMTATMRDTYVLLSNVLEVDNLALLALCFIAQIILTGQALLLSSGTVARELDSGTWELLLLTGRGAGQIVIAKWWAVLIFLYRQNGPLIFVRAGTFFWLGVTASRSGVFERPDLLSPFATPVLVLGFTFLDLALAASVGLVASVRIRRSIAYTAAIALFFVCVFAFAGAQFFLLRALGQFQFGMLPPVLLPMLVTPIDSAQFAAINLMHSLNASAWGQVTVATLVSLLTFAVLIGGLLGLARRLADRRTSRKA